MAMLQEETQARLEQMEPDVRRLARRWCRGRPDAADDLAQVARIAIWQLLKERPDTPPPYLVRRAEDKILNERKRGKSVDGRLTSTTARPCAWLVLSLEELNAQLGDTGDALESSPIHAHNLWESPVEGEVMGRVLYQMLREILTPKEDTYLSLLLLGYQHQDAGALLGITKWQAGYLTRVLRRKFTTLLDEDGTHDEPSLFQLHQQEAGRASWAKRPPFTIPALVQELLAQALDDL